MAAFLPSTRLGRVACWLAVGFLAWWFANQAFYVSSMAGVAPEGGLRVTLIVLSLLGMATGIAAGVVALVAILRSKERAVAVYLCLIPGAFALLFVAGELVFPH